MAALEDDLNTPLAISHLHEIASQLNKATDPAEKRRLAGELRAAGAIMGLLQGDAVAWFRWQPAGVTSLDETEIAGMIQRRLQARKAKNFAEADRIRDELKSQGVVLEDTAGGTTWKRAS
jgi:cysteinyl-tRNA synthetase